MSEIARPQIDWLPIASAPHDRFILVACKSGYVTLDWVFRVARYEVERRSKWRDEASDALTDAGHVPEFWCELPEEPDGE